MSVPLHFRIKDSAYEKLVVKSAKENRSISSHVAHVVERDVERVKIPDGHVSRREAAGRTETAKRMPDTGNPNGRAVRPARARKRGLRFGGVKQNPEYLAFIRTFPCILNGLQETESGRVHVCSGRIEAAHTGMRGRGQKAADETALPMCVRAHRTGKDSHHAGSRVFWWRWGLDREKLVQKFNDRWEEWKVNGMDGSDA